MIKPSGEEIRNGIKSVLKELRDRIEEKSIDFAKDKGISIAANLVSKIPGVGDILKDWVLEYKQDPTELLNDMVKLDSSEWEKFEDTFEKIFLKHFSKHKGWLETKFEQHWQWENEQFTEIKSLMIYLIETIEKNDESLATEVPDRIKEGIDLITEKFGNSIDPNIEFNIKFKDNQLLSIIEKSEKVYSEKFDVLKDIEFYKAIGNVFLFYGSYNKALRFYNIALNIDPFYKDALNNKGIVRLKTKRYEEAIKSFDEALKIDSKFVEAWNCKGVALGFIGQRDEALICINNAIKLNPKYVEAWNSKGVIYYKLGLYKNALRCHNRSLKINKNYADAWNNKGTALGKLKRDKKALNCFITAIEINPRYASAWNNKGKALNNLGKKQEAKYCFKMAKRYGFKSKK